MSLVWQSRGSFRSPCRGRCPHRPYIRNRRPRWATGFSACRKSLFAPLPVQFSELGKFRKLLDWTRKGLFAPFTLSPLLCCGAAFHSLDKSGKTPAAEPAAGAFLREKEEKMKNTNRFQKILLPMLRFSGAPTSSVPLEYRKCCV